MKKNLFIAALAFVAMGANAQVVNTLDGYQAGDEFEKDGVKYQLIAVEDGNPVKVVGAVAEEVTVQEAFAFEGGDNYTVTDFSAGLAQMDLTKVTAVADEPIAIADAFFTTDTYDVADLYVPTGAMLKYANAAGWKNFGYIWDEEGDLYGDFDGNGDIDIDDYYELRNYLLDDDYEVTGSDKSADMDNSGDADIDDLYILRAKVLGN